METPLLEVKNLRVEFALSRGVLTAVDSVSFRIHEKEALGIVGETGCGKSVMALSILGLVPSPPGKVSGSVSFNGQDIVGMTETQLCAIRGRHIGMIFQEPLTSLNPSLTIGEQVSECYRAHLRESKRLAWQRAEHILNEVRVPSPKTLMRMYPHELSGGMRQRVMIAIALACQPKLLIADEPTTALDVTIQAQIIELLEELREKLGLAMIFISHNLTVVARLCDRIAVMYAGSLVELANTPSLVSHQLHPYTGGLFAALPRPALREGFLNTIPGTVCDLVHSPRGCKFHPRCFKRQEVCEKSRPELEHKASDRAVACFFPE
ncbi:MAG TPA: ABC transporter ATP-binding protein [Candidatus Eisenbacteria bacterium]|nr:ABC transporter ATP-binding protein [Candidatus Eisenbacteria bacterium]